jgi:hypothetical protein
MRVHEVRDGAPNGTVRVRNPHTLPGRHTPVRDLEPGAPDGVAGLLKGTPRSARTGPA